MFERFYLFFVSSILLIMLKLKQKKPGPIFGIYQRPNGLYWIKVIFMFIFLYIRQLKNKLFPYNLDYYNKIDNVQQLAYTAKAADAVFFCSANKQGDYFVIATARRKNRLIDGFLFLKIQSLGLGVLQLPKAPDSSLFNTGNEQSYEAEGIKISSLEPMRRWSAKYQGQLRECDNREKLHDVKINAIWSSDEPWFHYDTDMDPWDMAKVLAHEKWSRNYFKNNRRQHQTHYEQFGILKADIEIGDKKFKIDFDSMRDHSVASHRDWAEVKRYGMHFLTAENGDHFSLGSLCFPLSFSRLKIGYMYNSQEKKMYPVTNSNLELYQHGELGQPPKDYAFTFKAGKKEYTMQVNVLDSPYVYLSKDWEVKIYERLCTFEINGVKGWGTAEWLYRNIEGRNVEQITK